MPLSPDVAHLAALAAENFPALGTRVTDAAEARRIIAEAPTPQQFIPVGKVLDRDLDGPDGGSIPVRVYWPATATSDVGVVVFFHGGGWVLCDLDSHDGTARQLANRTGSIVVSVDYRRAPEHRFPAAAEDAYAALEWAGQHAAELGGDPARVAVAGDSAGGNLATVAASLAVERGGPGVVFQLLAYPVTDHDFTTESYVDSSEDCLLTTDHMRWFWEQYVPDPGDRDNPLASPLRADLTGLPPAHVVTAERDPLRSEGERYAERLRESGVPTTLQRCPDTFHGFFGFSKQIPAFADEMNRAFDVLAEALAKTPSTREAP